MKTCYIVCIPLNKAGLLLIDFQTTCRSDRQGLNSILSWMIEILLVLVLTKEKVNDVELSQVGVIDRIIGKVGQVC